MSKDITLAGFTVLIESDGGRVDWGRAKSIISYSSIKNLQVTGTDQLSSEIWTMNPDGSDARSLTGTSTAIPHLSNDQPAFRAQGDYILFQCADPNLKLPGIPDQDYFHMVQGGFGYNNNLWVMTADGVTYTQLTTVSAGDGILHPHFSPDGSQVFWSSSEPGRRGGLGWILKVADFTLDWRRRPTLRNERVFTPLGQPSGAQVYEAHAVSKDNSTLLYSYSPGQPLDMDIWQTNIATNTSTNLTADPDVWDEHAHWNPDGDTIAWISSKGMPFTPNANWQKTLRTDVWLMDPDGSNKRKLTNFNDGRGYAICADLEWSPDGKQIILCRSEMTQRYGTRQQIVRLDLNVA